jgi:hypothetical protein
MKKSIFALAFALIGTMALAGTPAKSAKPVKSARAKSAVVVTQKNKAAAESAGLYCHVKTDTGEATCWFCNCKKLAENL